MHKAPAHLISKHTLLDVSGLKSGRALYKVWHIAAKLSHETNLAITKLSLFPIRNTIGLPPMHAYVY